MANILWFNEVTMKDVAQVGGKGASLGEMVQNNFPVPNGFIVTSNAYFDFVEEAGIKQKIISIIDSIDVENTKELEEKTKQVREIILKSEMPIEIKSAQTFNESYLKAIHQWNGFSKNSGGILLYDGKQEFTNKEKIKVLNWKNADLTHPH